MMNMERYFIPLKSLFGASPISLDMVPHMENKVPNLMIYALPAVLLFTIIEFAGSCFSEHKSYENTETKGSILIGLGSLLVNLVMKTVVMYACILIYNELRWRIELNWWTIIPCFIVYDCCSYWSHRISHFNRFFWASHVVHHSADHYNLTVAFRQSWVQHVKVMFFIPVVLFGFHPVVFMIVSQISTLYQFWVHTEAIGKLHPFIEKHFGTPSNHRVHHGSQEKYLDKNFGATFMIWDHLFESFQYEEEKPVYGLTTPVADKSNPFTLNFKEYRSIFEDVRNSRNLGEALFYIFGSPGKVHKKKLALEFKRVRVNQPILIKKKPIVLLLFLLTPCFSVKSQPVGKDLPVPKTENLLFFLQRDPNRNTVIYELNYNTNGALDTTMPVKCSWIRYEANENFKALNGIEERYAYGVKSKSLGNDQFEIRLVSYKKLPLYLMKSESDQKYRMYIKDGDENLLLKRVFVQITSGSFWLPKIKYIDLITVHSETGQEILKRITL
jgi:sterol desaturase/sphingolipid hydroxylase (fatty acid hydroxylase superfamily)